MQFPARWKDILKTYFIGIYTLPSTLPLEISFKQRALAWKESKRVFALSDTCHLHGPGMFYKVHSLIIERFKCVWWGDIMSVKHIEHARAHTGWCKCWPRVGMCCYMCQIQGKLFTLACLSSVFFCWCEQGNENYVYDHPNTEVQDTPGVIKGGKGPNLWIQIGRQYLKHNSW